MVAGGGSTRYGGVLKGLLPLGGRRIVDRVLDALAAACDDVFLVANDPAIAQALPDVRIHGDVGTEHGSLVGLYSGVSRVRDAALVVAWDMPFVSAELLQALRKLGETRGVAVFPASPRGPEPLCAYYPASTAVVMRRQIERGVFRLGALVDGLSDSLIVPVAEVARFGDPQRLFANINSPLDLERSENVIHTGQ